mmetsp:Transcript_17131/g.41054  ORF Transcript_17131/g.41054 Transcript_17131/m.41054 type:complete len:252 (-) Transcript_17131:142-897(-)
MTKFVLRRTNGDDFAVVPRLLHRSGPGSGGDNSMKSTVRLRRSKYRNGPVGRSESSPFRPLCRRLLRVHLGRRPSLPSPPDESVISLGKWPTIESTTIPGAYYASWTMRSPKEFHRGAHPKRRRRRVGGRGETDLAGGRRSDHQPTGKAIRRPRRPHYRPHCPLSASLRRGRGAKPTGRRGTKGRWRTALCSRLLREPANTMVRRHRIGSIGGEGSGLPLRRCFRTIVDHLHPRSSGAKLNLSSRGSEGHQ